jgi:hypothetical protein
MSKTDQTHSRAKRDNNKCSSVTAFEPGGEISPNVTPPLSKATRDRVADAEMRDAQRSSYLKLFR